MGLYSSNGSVPNTILISVIVFVFAELILAVPVSIESNNRALHRRNAWNENHLVTNMLLSQQQQQKRQNDTTDSNPNRREIQTGDGTSSAEDIGDGSDEVELDDGDGTFSNDTQAGSRLRKNATEPCSLEPTVLCPSVAPHSNRDKQRRIAHIVNYLWTNLFENRTRSVKPTPERFNPVNPSSSSFSGGLESISATCDLPSEVESEAWSSERYLSLYFNLSSKYSDILGPIQITSENSSSEPQQQGEGESLESGHSQEYLPVIGSRPFLTTFTITPTKTVNIISAKLRLYKIGTSDNTNNVPSIADIQRTSEPCNDTDANTSDSLEDVVPSVFPTRMTFPSVDEKIRVSVFWYTQPATKNHYKKKLVDAKMLSLRESSWVEFDIKNAATAWLNERKPNYGLVIEVENENQDALDPRQYFHGAPCFKTPTSEGNEETEKDINSAMSPIIEICTLNVPQTTTNYEHTKFFPFSMNVNSINHLQRVAESHAKSSNSNGSSARPRFPSTHNINLNMLSPEDFGIPNPSANRNSDDQSGRPTKTIVVPNHRHRHHHDLPSQTGNDNERSEATGESRRHQRGKARPSNTQQFTLDEDHPLRQILASVNGNSKESNRRASGSQQFPESLRKGFPSHLLPDMPADEGKAEVDYFDSTEHDKDVFITKIVISPAQLKNGFGNRRVFLPFASSMATSASSSVVPPTASTNVDSSER